MKSAALVATLLSVLCCAEAAAQARRPFALRTVRGETGPVLAGSVAGRISDDRYLDVTFSIAGPRTVDITLFSPRDDSLLTFDILGPDGNVLQQSIGDFLDELTQPGVYRLRV